MMKRFFILLLIVLAASCSRTQTIEIGLIMSATGNYSPHLSNARNGAVLAIEEIESLDRFSINLVIEDDESSGEQTRAKAESLFERGIDIIIMSVTSSSYGEAEEFINSHKVLAVSPTVASDAFSGKDDNFIRLASNISAEASYLGVEAAERGFEKIVIIHDADNLTYTEPMLKAFSGTLTEHSPDVEISILEFKTSEQPSFSELGESILHHSPDAALIIASAFETAFISQHIHGRGITLLFSSWAISDELIENGGRAVEDALFYLMPESPRLPEFRAKYLERFGAEPTFVAISNYDAVYIICQAIENSKKITPEALKHEIISQGRFEGINATYNFDEYGDCSYDQYLYTIKESTFITIESDT